MSLSLKKARNNKIMTRTRLESQYYCVINVTEHLYLHKLIQS